GHVMDVSDYEPKSRGYRKGGGQLMHTDSCDIIGLMCLKSAISGGESRISSALAVYNEMLDKHPDLLDILEEGLYLKRTDEDGRRAPRTFSEHRVPFFHEENGEVTCYLPTGYARLAEKCGKCNYTAQESDAVHGVRKVAEAPDRYLDRGVEEGDIQCLNKRMMVRGRTGYQDAKHLADRRRLHRLSLQVKERPNLPDAQIFH